jgi:leader peptidase (prepilin peptidase)/N-methyltransferase
MAWITMPATIPLILAGAAGVLAGTWLQRVAVMLGAGHGDGRESRRSQRGVLVVANGLLWLAAVWHHGPSLRGAAIAALASVLLLILVLDWRHHLIFDGPIVVGLALAFGAAALFPPRPQGLLWALGGAAGAGLAFLAQYWLLRRLYGRAALGSGDVLLAILVGAITGRDTPRALFIGALLGGLLALLYLLLGRGSRQDPLPYGSCLAAGAIATLLLL